MPGIDSLVADDAKRITRLENREHLQPLKIAAYPNDVIVYYEQYAVVYHAEGSGNSRHNISEAIFSYPTAVIGDIQSEPDFIEPAEVSEEIRVPPEDPYYKQTGGT